MLKSVMALAFPTRRPFKPRIAPKLWLRPTPWFAVIPFLMCTSAKRMRNPFGICTNKGLKTL
jgi:hypothetical protein